MKKFLWLAGAGVAAYFIYRYFTLSSQAQQLGTVAEVVGNDKRTQPSQLAPFVANTPIRDDNENQPWYNNDLTFQADNSISLDTDIFSSAENSVLSSLSGFNSTVH